MSGSPVTAPGVRLVPSPTARRWLPGGYALFQDLSLDIVAGVACAAALAVSVTGATMPLSWWVLLPLFTWVVYSVDHLLDARHTGAGARQSRHRFYHRRFATLTGLTLALLVAGTLSGAVWLPGRLLAAGLFAGMASAIHLALVLVRSRALVKEVSTATIYVGSVWFGPLLLAQRLDGAVFALAALHWVAAFANLVAFALFEEPLDILEGHASIVRAWGRRAAGHLLTLLTLVGVAGVLVTTVMVVEPRPAATLVLLILIVIPGVMVWRRETFGAGQRYRIVGDLAFLLMVLPWLLGR